MISKMLSKFVLHKRTRLITKKKKIKKLLVKRSRGSKKRVLELKKLDESKSNPSKLFCLWTCSKFSVYCVDIWKYSSFVVVFF